MKILFSPFARSLPNMDFNPKDYVWPEEVVKFLGEQGHEVVQVGIEGERQVANEFKKGLSFTQLGDLILACDTAITVDSYLQHHFDYLGKRAIVIFGVSDPLIFGHPRHINLLKDRKYLRPNQFETYNGHPWVKEAFVEPEEVVCALENF